MSSSEPVTTLTFQVPNHLWLSSNQRLHWAQTAKRVATLREHALMEGKARGLRYRVPVHITAYIGYPTSGRADPANAHPTIKAYVDGLVAARCLIDDSHEWVIGPDYRRDPVKAARGFHTVRLVIEEVGE